jgi:hypothetical protein
MGKACITAAQFLRPLLMGRFPDLSGIGLCQAPFGVGGAHGLARGMIAVPAAHMVRWPHLLADKLATAVTAGVMNSVAATVTAAMVDLWRAAAMLGAWRWAARPLRASGTMALPGPGD